jgi:hypothetical protein
VAGYRWRSSTRTRMRIAAVHDSALVGSGGRECRKYLIRDSQQPFRLECGVSFLAGVDSLGRKAGIFVNRHPAFTLEVVAVFDSSPALERVAFKGAGRFIP